MNVNATPNSAAVPSGDVMVSGSTVNPAEQPNTADDDFDLSQYSILIVDDNAQNVELLQAYLEVLPCTIRTACDGLDAIRIIEGSGESAPDLILLDVMMPKMSGFEVCRKIKEDPATQSIPVMMVTALNELGDIERGVECGADDFLSKPVNKLELITRAKSLLRVRHLKRKLDRTMAYIQDIEFSGDLAEDAALDADPDRVRDEPDPGLGPIG